MKRVLTIIRAAFVLTMLLFVLPADGADDAFKLVFDYDSRSVIDSTRRDWYENVYDPATVTPLITERQYDRTFFGSRSDLMFAVEGDLNETHFLDIKERLNYLHYNKEDVLSRDYTSFKYRELDHYLNVTWGIAAGDHDYFQFDFHNHYLDMPELENYSFRSNAGSALMSHEFSQRTCFNLTGSYEEREFENDLDANYSEARGGFEIVSLIPGRHKYTAVANSTRGDRSYFAAFPNGMAARKAVDYYTHYVVNPRDDDPRAKYIRQKTRGDLFLKVFADLSARDRNRLDNSFDQAAGGFEAAYEIAEDLTLRLRDTYRRVNYQRESGAYFLNDYSANFLSLAADYDYTENMTQTFTFIDELQSHPTTGAEDFRINSLIYEGFYTYGRSRASLVLSGLRRRYEQKRLLYPDEDESRAMVAWDYLVTDTVKFRMKSEFINREFINFEDELYSSHNRNNWRVGVEKSLSQSNSLELAFQLGSEKHETFRQNNLEEKSLHFSWISHY
ncbi:MAG: hypothetical protein ACD_39C00098G0003 [uncultured bacterium]|nr:MAG: hypothetical protein ACD_39C00098G0003 [uncultured bacterium]